MKRGDYLTAAVILAAFAITFFVLFWEMLLDRLR